MRRLRPRTDTVGHRCVECDLLLHGIRTFRSPDVMRFLGRKLDLRFQGEVVSNLRERPEGVRIEHRRGRNSVKLYDKASAVLRAETTINDSHALKVYRTAEGNPGGQMSWRPMRKGLADQHARAKASQAVNERYLDALADVDTAAPLGVLLADVCKGVTWNGKRVRGLRPVPGGDLDLLQVISRGEFTLDGLRNRDIQVHLFTTAPKDADESRRRCARVTRLLRLLRAHGILHKLPHTHRYKLSPRPGPSGACVLARPRVLPSARHDGVGTRDMGSSRLDTGPVRTPVNASPPPSRADAHDSGPGGSLGLARTALSSALLRR